jgi:hypothetical protein
LQLVIAPGNARCEQQKGCHWRPQGELSDRTPRELANSRDHINPHLPVVRPFAEGDRSC